MLKKVIKFLFVLSMTFSLVIPEQLAIVFAITESQEQVLTIPVTQTTGETNLFTFAEGKWDGENDKIHRWSKPLDKNKPDNTFYEVKFRGNKIDVYAGGNHPMGEVAYYIDGEFKETHNLYNPTNVPERKIATYSGLSEDVEHTFKAVATGKKGNGNNNLIDAGKIVVFHNPYKITEFNVSNETLKLVEGSNSKINISNIQPSYATTSDLSFTSDRKDVADVNQEGVISAESEGEATITISSKNGNLSKQIKVIVEVGIPEMSGSIIDTNTQYTQDRYVDINDLGKKSESLTAWKNDKALSKLILVSKDLRLKDVTVTASDLINGKEIIEAKNVKATFIKSTKAYDGPFLGYGNPNNKYPTETQTNRKESSDILYQDASQAMDIKAKSIQPVWVEFNIPNDAKAGTYRTKLTVNAKGIEKPLEFTYEIKVQDAKLPNAIEFGENFDIELWQYPYSIAEYYGVNPFSDEHFKILEPHMELYKSIGGHAITTTISEDAWGGQTYSKTKNGVGVHYPSMIKWVKKNGVMTYDYTNFDKWVNFNKKLGIGDKIVIYSIAPWHNCFTYWENEKLVKESYLNPNGTYKENYKVMWTNFLNDLIKHLELKGWFEESYIGIDERGFSKEAFDLIDSVTGSTAKPLKTAGAMDNFVNKYDLALRVSDLNVGDSAAAKDPEKFSQLVKDRESKGYRTTLYSCTEHVPGNFSLSSPAESYWSIINAGEETSGFLRWAYDAWVEDPLNDATHNAFEPGDCFLVYPGDKIDGQVPVTRSSVRLERMAEGVRDVNKLKMIAKEIPSLEDDISEIYDKLSFKAYSKSKGHLLTESELKAVIQDTTEFKKAVEEITNKYIDYKNNASKDVTSIQIISDIKEISLGSSLKLNAKVSPDKVLNNQLIWTSSKPKIISVDNEGTVTAHKMGTVDITVISKSNHDKKYTVRLIVKMPEVDPDSRVAYYSFDNSNAKDLWGNRHGIDNGVTFVPGKSGNAISVSPGKNITFKEDSTIKEMHSWTISYWVKSTTPIQNRVSVLMDKNKDYSFDLKMESNRASGVHVGKQQGSVLTFDHLFKEGEWYNISWTQDKKQGLSLYVNGKKVGVTNDWTTKNTFKAPLDILGGDGFIGLIDEVKVYNKVLSESEINADMLTKGLNLIENDKTLGIGENYEIDINLISDEEDKTITFDSNNPEIAKVDNYGNVSALNRGIAIITVKNAASGYTDTVKIKVVKDLSLQNKLTKYNLNEKYLKDIEKSPYTGEGKNRQYLGQPDMIRTKTGRLITAYPIGHGHGPIIMQISDDNGETWNEKTDTPNSWAYSQETPTLYTLNMPDGSERLMMINACPGWGEDKDGNKHGWNTSYSDDNGITWTQYVHWFSTFNNGDENPVVVGMASLIQLKDEKGNYIPKWMGVYHDQTGFVNYKTYLTFDENGKEQWSEPVPYLSEYRDIESKYKMCEIGMFRSPDGKRILGLARSQSHNNLSTLIYSDDEGETWSEPIEMQGALAGERHKAAYDPISGRLLITFREIRYDLNGNNKFEGDSDWRAGDWVAWVGTYEDLLEQNNGDYMITLSKDYSQNRFGGDTGYAGLVVLEDGTFIMDSYGHWDEKFSTSWKDSNGSYNVKTDLSYIRQAKFKLSDIENENDLIDYSKLNDYIQKVQYIKGNNYRQESYRLFTQSLEEAKQIVINKTSQQIEVDKAYETLKNTVYDLKEYLSEKSFDQSETSNEVNEKLSQTENKISSGNKKDYEILKNTIDDLKEHLSKKSFKRKTSKEGNYMSSGNKVQTGDQAHTTILLILLTGSLIVLFSLKKVSVKKSMRSN